MKIAVYKVETLTPKDDNEYHDACDILNVPSLKYGTFEMITNFSHWITKTELKSMRVVSARFYDRNNECWREGVMATELSDAGHKQFIQYAGKL